MQTKNVVIFLVGGVAGYLLCQYMSGKIEGVTPPTISTEPTPTPAPSPGQIDPKVLECNSKLNIQLANQNIAPDKVQEFSDSFMRDCLTSN